MPRPAREALLRPRRGLRIRRRRRRWRRRRSGVTGLVVRNRFRPDYSAHNAPGERVAVGMWQGLRDPGKRGRRFLSLCVLLGLERWGKLGEGSSPPGNCGTKVKRRDMSALLALETELPTLTRCQPTHRLTCTTGCALVVTLNTCLSDFDITFQSFTKPCLIW
uniref:Uncharacterized protein n=1 Tax=Myotis myotis TaxID=51298 RepID=A0A7J7WVP5_MYOMY|nr:hypothetical protein mMyoMyo1_011919 [Myotis myotis]